MVRLPRGHDHRRCRPQAPGDPAQRSGPVNGPGTTVDTRRMADQSAAQARGMADWGGRRQTAQGHVREQGESSGR
jgi:hypothetical protein